MRRDSKVLWLSLVLLAELLLLVYIAIQVSRRESETAISPGVWPAIYKQEASVGGDTKLADGFLGKGLGSGSSEVATSLSGTTQLVFGSIEPELLSDEERKLAYRVRELITVWERLSAFEKRQAVDLLNDLTNRVISRILAKDVAVFHEGNLGDVRDQVLLFLQQLCTGSAPPKNDHSGEADEGVM